jgi:hypothetical protein
MRPFSLILALSLAAGAAAQQALVCPPAPGGRACEAFHYHVALYRPDTRQFVEVTGVNQFATQNACDRARDAQLAANATVVDALRAVKQQLEPNKFGPCHCDLTMDKSSPTYLTDAQRMQQLRTVEEVRLRVRERLLDEHIPSDSEAMHALYAPLPSTPQLGAPRIVTLPQTAPVPVATSADELRSTAMVDTTKPAVAALDLPLVELEAPPPAPAAAASTVEVAAQQPATEAQPAPAPQTPPAAETTAPAQTPVSQTPPAPIAETHVAPEPAVEAPPEVSPDLQAAADRFITYETERIQNVLKASEAIADENVKGKIFDAAMQRIQLLSNLRLLIEGSGVRSRLAAAARAADDESARLALVAKLFGDDIAPHWAPHDASDVVFDIDAAIAAAPERALRDTTGRFNAQQKKRALYLVLAQTQPAEDQRLWLTSLVEEFLK